MAEVRSDVLKRLADLVDGDQWQIADLLLEEFPPDEYGDLGEKANTGLYAELEDYEHALVLEYGIELKARTMRIYRATGLAWPHDTRSSSVPFDVCKHHRGEDRFVQVRRYLKRNNNRPLTRRAAARYRAEDSPGRPARPWEDQVRHRIEAAAKAALLEGIKTDRPDWWNADAITEGRRKVIINALRKLANEMAA